MPWSTKISGTVERGEVTYFSISVKVDTKEWSVDKRFSEFVALDTVLSGDAGLSCLALPSRDSLGIRRRLSVTSHVEKRQSGLEEYLAHLVPQIKNLADNATLHKFLTEEGAMELTRSEGSFMDNPYAAGMTATTKADNPYAARRAAPAAAAAAASAPAASSTLAATPETPTGVVGPHVVLILKPPTDAPHKVRQKIIDIVDEGFGCNLKVDTIDFPEDSPLHKHKVFLMHATCETVMELAENEKLPKPRNGGEVWEDGVTHRKWSPFSRAEMSSFAGHEDPMSFFTPHEVLVLLCARLHKVQATELDGHPVLLAGKVAGEVECVMCLHDGEELEKKSENWKTCYSLTAEVPVQDLAGYFGQGSAMYFAFMHTYARWLVLPAGFCTASLLLFEAWHMSTGKKAVFATSWFSYAVCLFVTIWSTLFSARCQHMVKVLLNSLGHDSLRRQRNTFDMNSAEVYFSAIAELVTNDSVAATTKQHRGDSMLPYAFMVVSMALLLGITALIIGVLLWVGDFVAARTDNIILVNLPTVLYIVIVGFFEIFYKWLAHKLTQIEQHRMYSEYLRSLTYKSAAFNIMNTLGWFFYVAFWQQDMTYLRSQLLTFFTLKQVIGNVTETGIPRLKRWWNSRKEQGHPVKGHAGQGHQLCADIQDQWQRDVVDLGEDFCEVVTLFAAAIWFAPVFPLGMLLAFVHALTEASSDRYKMCFVSRRPLPDPYCAVMYDAWLLIMSAIGCIGVPVSMGVVYVAHEGAWAFQALVAIEHLILFVKLYLLISIPHEPEWLNHHLTH